MAARCRGALAFPARLVALLLAGVPAWAGQKDEGSFPAVDPYTEQTPVALQEAGYVSFGPFRFGDDHATDKVAAELGVPLLWVETAHFKLGSGLQSYRIDPDPAERKKLRAELEALGRKLPNVKARTRELDPWLRLHLFARRLENLVEEFQACFQTTDTDWPSGPWDQIKRPTAAYMGEGRYLGMPGKFTVLLLEKKSDLARYSARFLGGPVDHPMGWSFPETGSLLFVTAYDCLEGDYQNELALACSVLAGVTHNLGDGFRGDRIRLPLFLSEGLGHWFARRYDPRFFVFSGSDPTRIRSREQTDWAPSVRARVRNNVFPTCGEMFGWRDADALDWADHLMAWSRVDHLLALEDGGAGKFLRALKDPTWVPTGADEARERLLYALRTSSGLEPEAFDQAWCEWVMRAYPRK